jgi:flagellar hook-associated protein 3 FlgL
MQISTNYLFDRASAQMSQLQNDLAKSQAQISAQKQVLNPSDAPDQAASITRLKSVIGRNDNYASALDTVQARLETESTTLSSASDVLIRIKELAIQANNGTQGNTSRAAIATEMQGLRDQLLSLANSTDTTGNYVFSGSKVRTPAFTADSTGAVSYQGDQTRMHVAVGDQRTIAVNRPGTNAFVRVVRTNAHVTAATTQGVAESSNKLAALTFAETLRAGQSVTVGGLTYTATKDTTAKDLAAAFASLDEGARTGAGTFTGTYSGALTGFSTGQKTSDVTVTATSSSSKDNVPDLVIADSNGTGFFQSIDDLIKGVKTADSKVMQRGLTEMDALHQGVVLAQAQSGTDMKVLEQQRAVLDDTKLTLKTALSNVEDLDMAVAITQMQKQMLSLEAAQASFAKVSQLSLFNYLK